MKDLPYNLYWGDTHTQFGTDQLDHIDASLRHAASVLDFMPVIYYPHTYYMKHGVPLEPCKMGDHASQQWSQVKRFVLQHHAPGSFVTFPGFEWHGVTGDFGDHNVIFLDDDAPLCYAHTLPELYQEMPRGRAIAIPHHTGYAVGERGKNWDFFDPELTPFAEIFSHHGSSEGEGTPIGLTVNRSMGPLVNGGTIQDGLARGHHFGIIASGDHPGQYAGAWGDGLMGVYARRLTRKSLWEAFSARRVYGVTGDRIRLLFFINGHFMGQHVQAKGPVEIAAQVVATDAIDRIEIIRNNHVVYTHCQQSMVPERKSAADPLVAKLRVECGWGPLPLEAMQAGDKTWRGRLRLQGGEIVDVEPCFTFHGQQLGDVNEKSAEWELLTRSTRQYPLESACFQSLVFEVRGTGETVFELEIDSQRHRFTLADALRGSQVIAMRCQVEEFLRRQLKLDDADLANRDIFYHNAYKTKIHRAVLRNSYEADCHFIDEDLRDGENYYYLRVTQRNGQMAWSSPIWVTR